MFYKNSKFISFNGEVFIYILPLKNLHGDKLPLL